MLPLAGPGFGAAAAMVFISVVTELNATLLLAPLDTHTLATQIWSDTRPLLRRRVLCGAAHLHLVLHIGPAVRAARTLRRGRRFMSDLHVQGLHKSFDRHAVLHGIDFAMSHGTLFALLGPSGSGKTTLLRLLCRFERADAGTIDFDGRRVEGPGAHVPAEQRRIGYVPQEGTLFPHLSVAENIVFGLPRGQRRAHHRVAELIELVGLPSGYAQRVPQQISGGQQHVALAQTSTTAALVTHDQVEALSLGQRSAVLWNGKLVQSAPAQAIYRRPATRELAEFIGDAVLLRGSSEGDFARCAPGRLRLFEAVEGCAADVMIRPKQIRLAPAASHGCGQARLTGVAFSCRDALVELAFVHADGTTTITACVHGHAAHRRMRGRVRRRQRDGYAASAALAVLL
ncbi:Ferric iron ABC transporter, ATP-binding protein [Candidatus Paraburkholderia calva]|nr:Ferric iron ABC transporter, ATP-binding protein [Candidatus Paraburkholderia calva]